MKKNISVNGLYELKSGRELNPLKKVPSEKRVANEEKKKLNIDLGKLKMDILSELNKNKNKSTSSIKNS